jgi:hypothetical protein
MVRTIATLVLALVITLSGSLVAHAAVEIEDYAPYQPQTRCSPKAKAGTLVMSRFVHRRFGGGSGSISRPCRSGGTSEHKEGRAYDWPLDATRKRDRQTARAFMDFVFAADKHGNEDARARRMGIMYVIWNDHMYSAWNGFEKSDYLSSSCKKVTRCSKTLRHRNHVHISLSRKGGRGETSWYADRL